MGGAGTSGCAAGGSGVGAGDGDGDGDGVGLGGSGVRSGGSEVTDVVSVIGVSDADSLEGEDC